MKDPKLVESYDRCLPDEATKERLLQSILAKKSARASDGGCC